MKKNILQSLLVALIVALLFPALWVGFLGQTSRTPTIEKSFTDNMTIEEREKWFEANSKPIGLYEHIKTLPRECKLFCVTVMVKYNQLNVLQIQS